MPTTQETDGFQVKRPGDVNVKCTLLLMLDHQVPPICSVNHLAHSRMPGCYDFLTFFNHHFFCPNVFFPAPSVQTGPPSGSSAWCAHTDAGQYHASPLALHQEQQAAGLSREGVHQLQPLFQTGDGMVFRLHISRCCFDILKCFQNNFYVLYQTCSALFFSPSN